MWIVGIIAASLATTLLILLLKGGIKLVGAVVGAVLSAVIQAIGLVISGVIWAVAGIAVGVILAAKFLYRKITTRRTDVDGNDTYDWMKAAQVHDE